MTFLLLGVENIGIQIEEPFEVLPIETISAGCVAGVHEIMDRHLGMLMHLSIVNYSTAHLACLMSGLHSDQVAA